MTSPFPMRARQLEVATFSLWRAEQAARSAIRRGALSGALLTAGTLHALTQLDGNPNIAAKARNALSAIEAALAAEPPTAWPTPPSAAQPE